MTQQEFLGAVEEAYKSAKRRVKGLPELPEFREEWWEDVNLVYTWHPRILDVGGKKQIAEIYVNGGMDAIWGMLGTAEKMVRLDEEMQKTGKEVDALREAMKAAIKDFKQNIAQAVQAHEAAVEQNKELTQLARIGITDKVPHVATRLFVDDETGIFTPETTEDAPQAE